MIKERFGVTDDVVTKIDKGKLRWSGHLESMHEGRLTKYFY